MKQSADLNLLVALDALLAERNVTRTAVVTRTAGRLSSASPRPARTSEYRCDRQLSSRKRAFRAWPGPVVCGTHGGGYLPQYIGRADHAYAVHPASAAIKQPPSAYLRQIYFDSFVYSPRTARQLIDVAGVGHVLLSTCGRRRSARSRLFTCRGRSPTRPRRRCGRGR